MTDHDPITRMLEARAARLEQQPPAAPRQGPRPTPLKVRITVTVLVDPELWADNYGIDPADRAAIRLDADRYCYRQIAESAAADAGALIAL